MDEKIDFVLAYEDEAESELTNNPKDINDDNPIKKTLQILKSFFRSNTAVRLSTNDKYQKHKELRETFEDKLKSKGIQINVVNTDFIRFTLITIPFDLLKKYAAILKLTFPIKIKDEKDNWESQHKFQSKLTILKNKILFFMGLMYDVNKIGPPLYRLKAEYIINRPDLFDDDDESFFNSSSRACIASYIVEEIKIKCSENKRGIGGLVEDGVYSASYPLHEGNIEDNGSRRILFEEWAKLKNFMKLQPLHEIKNYFGAKVALYFAWMGYYTFMLLFASAVGVISFIVTLSNPTNEIVEDICKSKIIMCPRCDITCDYWRLSDGCLHAKLQHFIDNGSTIAFSIFMSLWAAVYMELWKRYSSEKIHEWGLTNFNLEAVPPRDAYILKVKKYSHKIRDNPVTKNPEPKPNFWKVKLPYVFLSFMVSNVWIVLTIIAVISIIVYRMTLATSKAFNEDRPYFVALTAPVINLVAIVVLQVLYNKLAKWLTELEMRRTQTEFDDSLSLKLYLFQFINFYSSIFYIAFFKGRFIGRPDNYNRLFGFRQEECNPGGCLMELTIQLAIIMIGKQLLRIAMKFNYHNFINVCMNCLVYLNIIQPIKLDTAKEWEQDYQLEEEANENYIEMVIQYGFVTIFVTAFPLAPLFGLLYISFQTRKDALNFVKYCRRPVPKRIAKIGIWFYIIEYISKLSILTNALILAFSSNFIPRLVYKHYGHDSAKGFVNNTLSFFNVSDFQYKPYKTQFPDVKVCRYYDYRIPNGVTDQYELSKEYWTILAWRLAFIVIYQNVIIIIADTIDRLIPDKSSKLKENMLREAYRINEILLNSDAGDK